MSSSNNNNNGPLSGGAARVIDSLQKASQVSGPQVGITLGVYLALAAGTLLAFNLLRPNNKIVYEPKIKYAEGEKRPPRLSEGFFAWVTPLMKCKEHDLLPIIGLDAITYLRFGRMMRYMITALTVVMCGVLMPVDVAYNTRNNTYSKSTLTMLTMADVSGASIWAHVAMSYVGTAIALGFIFVNYRTMVRLRWDWFNSEEYQTSFHARTLMITGVSKKLQSDPALAAVLAEIKMPYPTTEVHIGRRVGDLPFLIEKHQNAVKKLERILAKYLKDPNKVPDRRPTIRVKGKAMDAIEYYTDLINYIEAEIQDARERIAEKKPESYGFASLAAVPYAHAAAKSLKGKKPRGLQIELAPPPKDIIWNNLILTKAQRFRSSSWGFLLLVLVLFVNAVPLLAVSLITNMAAFIPYLGFLSSWNSKSQWSFAAVAGIVPPLISNFAGYLLPIIMRRIAKYRGAKTKNRLDRVVIGQYFGYLVVSQFVVFTLIAVAITTTATLVTDISQHRSVNSIFDYLTGEVLYTIKRQYFNLSNYWLTWLPVRGYMAIFDLAQVLKLLLVWFQKAFLGRTPRDVREYTKPPSFEYAIYYSNLLFMAAVAMLYATLAPLVVALAAIAFWLSSWVCKYQLMFVFTTKNESGGRLWRVVINRLLVCIVFMQVILALAVALDQTWIKAIVCLPPIIGVIGFKIFLARAFDEKFVWYRPSEAEVAKATVVHTGDMRHNRLQRRFGHPSLHEKLWTPMVHANVKHLLPRVYHGRMEQGTATVDGRRVDTEKVSGGLKIAVIEEEQLEYDPRKDSDNRSVISATTMATRPGTPGTPGDSSPIGTPGGAGPANGEYFRNQYNQYLASGPRSRQSIEEFEMGKVQYYNAASSENLIEKNFAGRGGHGGNGAGPISFSPAQQRHLQAPYQPRRQQTGESFVTPSETPVGAVGTGSGWTVDPAPAASAEPQRPGPPNRQGSGVSGYYSTASPGRSTPTPLSPPQQGYPTQIGDRSSPIAHGRSGSAASGNVLYTPRARHGTADYAGEAAGAVPTRPTGGPGYATPPPQHSRSGSALGGASLPGYSATPPPQGQRYASPDPYSSHPTPPGYGRTDTGNGAGAYYRR